MGRVVVVGAVNVDLVVRAPRLPGPGETVVGGGMRTSGGGKGANAAVAAARAGASVALIGAVGADAHGGSALAELRAAGVDVSGVAVLDDEPTGVALIVVDDAGENQIAVGVGANAAVGPVGDLGNADCVLVSTEVPDAVVVAAVRAARGPCVLNPAPVTAAVVAVLDAGPILTPNRSECRALAALLGEEDADVAVMARRLQARTGAPVVVTLGDEGVLVVVDGEVRREPAVPVTVRDTTGAGDAFNGVLAAGLAAGIDLDGAVRAAVAAASRSVERVGAR